MKAVLSLENRTILPNIKFNDPNPSSKWYIRAREHMQELSNTNNLSVPWDTYKLVVPVEPSPWPENKAERISVNSYGIGGSNVHVS